MGDPEFRIEGRPTMKSGPWWQTEDPKNPESKLVNFDKDMFVRAVKDYKAGAQARGDVAMGFEEVDHSDVAYDWLRDPTEIVRVKEVAARRAEGRGPPKKGEYRLEFERFPSTDIFWVMSCFIGQGKRSQMKRK